MLQERAPWLLDYKAECSNFTREMSHKHLDPTIDTSDYVRVVAALLGGTAWTGAR